MIDMTDACAEVAGLVEKVRDDQLAEPTPCVEYAVADLLHHLDQVVIGLTALAGSLPASDEPSADRAELAERIRALGAAWANPAAWDGVGVGAAGLELPSRVWGRIALTEVVVHGWDLAKATGVELALPDDALRHCLDHVVEFVPNAPLPQLWGTPAQLGPDATVLDRVLAATGRRP